MAGLGEPAGEAGLWAQYRAAAADPPADRDLEPDPLLLAAYAEGRLDESAAAPIELWLASHPERLGDLAAARGAGAAPAAAAPEAVIARATALLTAGEGRIVAFRPNAASRGGWRSLAAWSGIAASLLATSLLGFELGSDAYMSLSAAGQTAIEASQDLFDPPGSGILPVADEDWAT